jgi:hypothetical protein
MPAALDHTKLRHALLANGYTPLPAAGKVCNIPKWSRLEVTPEMVDDWADREAFITTCVRVDDDLLVLDFDIDDAKVLNTIERRIQKEEPELADLMLDMPKRTGGGAKYALFARRASGQYEQYWSKGYYKPAEEDAPSGRRAAPVADKRPLQRLEVFTGGGSKGRYMACYGAHTIGADGEVVRSYAWEDGIDLLEVPREELPALTLKQVKYMVDVVSTVMHEAKWEYEVRSVHGRVETTVSYTLLPEMSFQASTGEVLSLADLEALCDTQGLRVSLGFVEPGATNVSRGSVTRNAGDGHVQVWDFASATMYRPAVLDIHLVGVSLGRALQRNPHTSRDPANESDGDDRPFVDVGGGELTEASKVIARYLAQQKHLFNMGGRIVGVLDGAIIPMDLDRLTVEIGRRVCCRVEQQIGNAVRLVETDPSTKLVRMVAALLRESGFRDLRAVTDVPVLRRDGTLVENGYCPQTKLVVRAPWELAEAARERLTGTGGVDVAQARAALKVLWRPFAEFPFVGALDRGGALAALLTAAVRPVLPTAPAFGFDAPAQGSGKSLLSRSVSALAGPFKVYAPLPVKDDDEVRKVLLTVLLEAPRAAVFDNMLGLLDSGALGALLTSETFSGRMLGTNTSIHAPTAVLMILNGNNLAMAGDMPRRVVSVRIDPKDDIPHARRFDFDPEQAVRERRGDLLLAALTLIKSALPAARRGRVGSFEAWDEMIGQTVVWVRDVLDETFGDPAESIRQAVEFDPRREELVVLLSLLRKAFGNGWFSASEVSSLAGSGGPMAEALDVERHASPKSVGRYLTNRKDGRAGGLALQHRKDPRTKVAQFRVWSDEDSADVVVEGSFQRRKENVTKLTTMAGSKA